MKETILLAQMDGEVSEIFPEWGIGRYGSAYHEHYDAGRPLGDIQCA